MSSFESSSEGEDNLRKVLTGFDGDLLEYVISVVEGMTLAEKKSTNALSEAISPFLVDTG